MILIFAAVFFAVLVIAICAYCFDICFYSANKIKRDPYVLQKGEQYLAVKEQIHACTRCMDETPFEPINIQSFDGLTLYGRYYHFKDGAPVKLIFHGYHSLTLRDSAGGFNIARKLGLNVLAVDQRAHGNSGGHVITLGIRERHDCLSWVQYINTRFGSDIPIILSGLSMGATTVLMSTSLPLPKNVACVLADCPYSSPGEIMRKVCRDRHYPTALLYPFIRLSARIFGKFDLEKTNAVEAVKESKIPILLLHGEDDRFVPCEMSKKIHASSGGCTRLVTFPHAGHGLSYIIEPNRYEKVVFEFLKSIPMLQEHFNGITV